MFDAALQSHRSHLVLEFNGNLDDVDTEEDNPISRKTCGILVIEPEILFLSLPYANSVIRSINDCQFIDLASRSYDGLVYPTHIAVTAVGEVVVADTGNHRFGVFYGPQYMVFNYAEVLVRHSPDDVGVSVSGSHCCSFFYFCCVCKGDKDKRPDRSLYEPVN